jgi:hypothetical protein
MEARNAVACAVHLGYLRSSGAIIVRKLCANRQNHFLKSYFMLR